ncbi:uncharacterized protein LOC108631886 isoform X2 [Ceratina calcarata]|uniref:Uncharacterized protein LOC108631886 isoform X2 n=1 Tax=Ceratina calcarata TaxID=156304 RepID=A0AAJ7SBS7_9HYME|nr:uncharacterized protein LOC108631886 isoform X2 [Ceratina calcarata]
MSNSRYRRKEFGSRGAGVTRPSNDFGGSRFHHPNFFHFPPSSDKWMEMANYPPWQHNMNFHHNPMYRGNNLQFRPNIRNRAFISQGVVRYSSSGRPAASHFPMGFVRHPAPRELLPVEEEVEDKHQVPLPGSEEERQRKISETADKLKQKLSTSMTVEDLTHFGEEELPGVSNKTPEEGETRKKGIPELRHEPPELDLTFNDLRDIGRVDSNNSRLEDVDHGSNEDINIVEQEPTVNATSTNNVITIKDKKESEPTYKANDKNHELPEPICETENLQLQDNTGKKLASLASDLNEADGKLPIVSNDTDTNFISTKPVTDLLAEQSSAVNLTETSGNDKERIQKSKEDANRNIAEDINANIQHIQDAEIPSNTITDSATAVCTSYNEVYDDARGNKNDHICKLTPVRIDTRAHSSSHRFRQNGKHGFFHGTQRFNQLPGSVNAHLPSYSHNVPVTSHSTQQKASVPFPSNSYPLTFEPRSNSGSEKSNTSQGSLQTVQSPLTFDFRESRIQNVPLTVSEQVPEYNPKQPPPIVHKREETFQPSPFLDPRFSPQELTSYASPLNLIENSSVTNFNVSPSYTQLPPINVPPHQSFISMNFPPALSQPSPLLASIEDSTPPPPKAPTGDNFNDHRNMDDGMREGMKLARQIMNMTEENKSENVSVFPEVPSDIPPPDKTACHFVLAKGRDTNIATKQYNKKYSHKKDSRHVVHSTHVKEKDARTTMKDYEGTLLKDHGSEVLDINSITCRLKRTEEWLRTPINFPENQIHQSASLNVNKHRVHSKESQSRKSTHLAVSNEKASTSSDWMSDKRDSEKSQRVPGTVLPGNASTENNQKLRREAVKDKAPTSESSWKAKVISRFLKMSKNDICNMLNNASLRKFDIAMKHLVKERKPCLSLEMRNTEDEKMKEYDREEFMNQLNAMLDSGDIVGVKDLPTEFIHHLSEVLQLESLQSEVELPEKQASEVQSLSENVRKTEMENRSSSLNKIESKQQQQQDEPKVLLDETELNDISSEVKEKAKKIQRPSIFDSAGIAQAKKLTDSSAGRSRARKCCSEDRNPFRPDKYESWSREERENLDAYRNLTKEEWEARYKSKSSATASFTVQKTISTSSENLRDKRKDHTHKHCSSESPLRSSSASPVTRVFRPVSRPIETDESHSDSSNTSNSSDTSSTSSSSSHSDKLAVSPSVTKWLKVIKENEKIAKKKSVNEALRDVVVAEIEEQRKEKNKQKSREREKRRKHRKERRKRKRRISYTDSSESSKKFEEFRLLADDKGKKEVNQEDKINSFKRGSIVPDPAKSQIEKQQVLKVACITSMSETKNQSDQTQAKSNTQLKPVPKLIKVQIAKNSAADSNNGKMKSISVANKDKEVTKNLEQIIAPASVSLKQVNVSSIATTSACSTANKIYKKIDISAYKERKRLKDQTQLKENPKNTASTNQNTPRALPMNTLDSDKLNTTNETKKPEADNVQSKDQSLIGDQNKEVSIRTNLREERKPIARKDKKSLVSLESNSNHKNFSSPIDFDSSVKGKECLSDKKSSLHGVALETKKPSVQKELKPVLQKKKQSKKLISLFDSPKHTHIRSEGKKELKLKEMKNMKNKKLLDFDNLRSSKKHKNTSKSKQKVSNKKMAASASNSRLKIEDKIVREEIHSVIKPNQESVDGNERSTNVIKTIEKSDLSSQQIVNQTDSSINSKDENGNKKTESKVPSKELRLRINVDIEKSGPSINIKSLTNNSSLVTESKISEMNDVKQNETSKSLEISRNFNVHDKITKSDLTSPNSPSGQCKSFPAISTENDVNTAQLDNKDPIRKTDSPSEDAAVQQNVINTNDRSTCISEIKKDDGTDKRGKTSSEENQPAGDTNVSEKGNESLNVLHKYYRIVDKKSTEVQLNDVDLEDCSARDTDFFMDRSSDKVNPGDVISTNPINFEEVFHKNNADKEVLTEGKEKSTSPNKETTIKKIDSRQNSEFGVRPKPSKLLEQTETETATMPIVASAIKMNVRLEKFNNGLLIRQIPTLHGKNAPNESNQTNEATSKSEQVKDKSLHKIRHKSKLKAKKEKLKPPKETIKDAMKSCTVEVVKYPNAQEDIMARMIEIDVEIHKLMTEKMALYQMLTKNQTSLSNDNNLKESIVMQEQKSDASKPRTSIKLTSPLTREKTKTNETSAIVESSSVIETSINVGEPSTSKAENNNCYVPACTSDDGKSSLVSKKKKKKKKHEVRRLVPSAFPKIVLAEKNRADVNEAEETDSVYTDLDTKVVKDSSQVSVATNATELRVVIDKISTQTDNQDLVSGDKPEAANHLVVKPIEEIAEEKLVDIDNRPIRDNEERAASLKSTDTNCSEIRASIYSDDSTLDALPQHAGRTKEQKNPSVGLALLEETYKKEIAKARSIKRDAIRKRKKELRYELPKTVLTAEEEDLPLSTLYIKRRKSKKRKLPDSVVNQTDDDVLKKMDDVINAVAENKTEKLYTEGEPTEGTASIVSEKKVESKQNEEEQTLRNGEEPCDGSPNKTASFNAHELLGNKHLQGDTEVSRSSEASDKNPDKIESTAPQILKNENVETTELTKNTESRHKTNKDDKNIHSSTNALNNAEINEENRKPDEEAINNIEKVYEYSTALDDSENIIVISDTGEKDSKVTHERKSNEKDNIDNVTLQSNCKTKNDHFISLRNYKESHKAREIVKDLSGENGNHDYTSSVIKNTETLKIDEDLDKKLNKRKRENTKDTARRKSKYEEPVKKRTKSETSATYEPEERCKSSRTQDVSPALLQCEESRGQKKKRNTNSETDASYSDNECSKAIRKQKLHTISEMMNCVVKVVDCKRAASNLNVNPNVSQSYRISRINTQSQYHPTLTQIDSLISSQKESPQSQTSKTIKRSDDQTNFARVKRPKSAKIDTSDEEKCAEPVEVMPVLTKEQIKNNESSDVVVEDEKAIAKNQQPSENPPPTLTVIDTTADEELPRIQYTVHNGPILDIKVFGDSFLAASEDGRIYRYNQSSNGLLNIYKGHVAAVTCLHMCNASYTDISKEWIFSGSLDGTLRCYNVMTGIQARDTANVGSPIQCMDEAWGIIFVGTKSGHVSRYHIKSGTIKEDSIQFSDKSVLALKATNEGPRRVLIVASRSQPITIRDAQNGLFLRTICGQRSYTVYSLMRDHNLIYCGTSSTSIPVFDFTNGEQTMQYDAGVGIVCMRLYKSLLFAGCYDGNIYVFDTKEYRLVCSIPGPGNMLLSMEVVDNKIIAGSKDKRLQSWQMPYQVRSCI